MILPNHAATISADNTHADGSEFMRLHRLFRGKLAEKLPSYGKKVSNNELDWISELVDLGTHENTPKSIQFTDNRPDHLLHLLTRLKEYDKLDTTMLTLIEQKILGPLRSTAPAEKALQLQKKLGASESELSNFEGKIGKITAQPI